MTEAEQRTVAIVDDDHAVRESLRLLLEAIGYTVEIFASAADFLRANVRHFSCLILDLESAEFSATFWGLVPCAHSHRATAR
jgi:FixJ family two-component response regulator